MCRFLKGLHIPKHFRSRAAWLLFFHEWIDAFFYSNKRRTIMALTKLPPVFPYALLYITILNHRLRGTSLLIKSKRSDSTKPSKSSTLCFLAFYLFPDWYWHSVFYRGAQHLNPKNDSIPSCVGSDPRVFHHSPQITKFRLHQQLRNVRPPHLNASRLRKFLLRMFNFRWGHDTSLKTFCDRFLCRAYN